MFKVYIRTDEQGRIIAINSDAFLINTEGWTLLDEGEGDRFYHAQGNYFEKPLFTDDGLFRYKYENNKVVCRSEEEKEEDRNKTIPTQSLEERVAALENIILEQDSALMELAKLIIGGKQ